MKGFTVITAPQRSPEWLSARLGKLTSTGAADMLASLKKGGESAGRRNLRVRLALERITGRSIEREFMSQAMQDGVDREADAYAAYEAITGHLLTRTGFCKSTTEAAGCSLDGHVGDFEGLIEIKCPIEATHLDYLRSGEVPGDYLKQVMHALYITGAQWCDWMSYQPNFPSGLQTKIVRIQRSSLDMDGYKLAVALFLKEVDEEVKAIERLRGVA